MARRFSTWVAPVDFIQVLGHLTAYIHVRRRAITIDLCLTKYRRVQIPPEVVEMIRKALFEVQAEHFYKFFAKQAECYEGFCAPEDHTATEMPAEVNFQTDLFFAARMTGCTRIHDPSAPGHRILLNHEDIAEARRRDEHTAAREQFKKLVRRHRGLGVGSPSIFQKALLHFFGLAIRTDSREMEKHGKQYVFGIDPNLDLDYASLIPLYASCFLTNDPLCYWFDPSENGTTLAPGMTGASPCPETIKRRFVKAMEVLQLDLKVHPGSVIGLPGRTLTEGGVLHFDYIDDTWTPGWGDLQTYPEDYATSTIKAKIEERVKFLEKLPIPWHSSWPIRGGPTDEVETWYP
ncbi:Hypothetical protein D9617_11g008130 [Elsinoe fawcettii]|nr:Hypothetical protein D9617_11g008130 [Elsinoe fawcettii]